MRDKPWYPVVYMFVVTAAFSGILIGLSAATRERVEANERVFRERAILVALAVDGVNDKTPVAKVHELYRRITPKRIELGDGLGHMEEYQLDAKDDGTVAAVAAPIDGQGYWDQIRGVIGLKSDRKTIIGIAFYQQKETPGLGAEIAKKEWREQFVGKVLAPGDTPIDIRPPEATTDDSSVHAVTGATQTSARLERFMNAQLAAWRDATTEGGSQ